MKQLTQVNLVNVTTTQRDALTGVANGDVVYNTTVDQVQARVGGAWRQVVSDADAAAGRTTHGDSNYTIVATDRLVALTTTLTAPRAWTLPAASAYPTGIPLRIMDCTGTLTSTNYVTISRAGGDTLLNPNNQGSTTATVLRQPGAEITFYSTGTAWIVDNPMSKVAGWWTAPRDIAIPNNSWTPIPWGSLTTDPFLVAGTPPTATTTIASASNSVALPQATINVASTTGFASAGWATITIGTTDTVFHYTGVTSTTFTGCNSSPNTNLSAGTMATSQVVAQVVVEWTWTTVGYGALIAEIAWAASPTGVRGIRFRQMDGTYNLPAATTHTGALNIANQHMQVVMQQAPDAASATVASRIEVYQSSGGTLNATKDGLQSPSLMFEMVSGQAR